MKKKVREKPKLASKRKTKTTKKTKRSSKKPVKRRIKKQAREATKTTAKITKGKESNRIPTYLKNFDSMIEGGFDRNSANLLVGGSGSGKSIFATQFLIGGMQRGEKTLYVTFEEQKKQFYENMLRFGWNLEEYERKGLFTFLEYTPAKVQTMLEEGGGAIENIIYKKQVTRIVIDSITSFALLFKDELQKREAALNLFNMISKWSCTSLLTFEGEALRDEEMASRTLEFESDSITLLHFLKRKGERQRFIEILKMRGTKHSKKTYRFKIEKNGINIEKRASSGLKI